jgi:hypothetical protein
MKPYNSIQYNPVKYSLKHIIKPLVVLSGLALICTSCTSLNPLGKPPKSENQEMADKIYDIDQMVKEDYGPRKYRR